MAGTLQPAGQREGHVVRAPAMAAEKRSSFFSFPSRSFFLYYVRLTVSGFPSLVRRGVFWASVRPLLPIPTV